MKYLLDTHVLVRWIGGDRRLSRAIKQTLDRVRPERPALVSSISFWEIASLVSLKRMKLDTPLREWLQDIAVSTSLSIESITPAIAAATAELPDCLHRDPADRIILATARVLGATLITLDERLIESKLVATLC